MNKQAMGERVDARGSKIGVTGPDRTNTLSHTRALLPTLSVAPPNAEPISTIYAVGEKKQILVVVMQQPATALSNISLGRAVSCQHGAFSGVGAFVVSFVPAECPVGGGMWGIFGKPLKRAIRNTPGLHAVLTTCLRFFSALDSACVACCLFLLTGSHHVFIQIHTTCCCFP